ncbi:TRAM domain-containing protein [Candidatus Micrarchaeota archaeon]|nr:TRAM domain-containing protein [Candidatus Micrarchaeota archaeon]
MERPKPVSVGQILQLEIENQNGHGEGIAHYEDLVIFVNGTKKGEKCKVKISEIKRTYAVAEKV